MNKIILESNPIVDAAISRVNTINEGTTSTTLKNSVVALDKLFNESSIVTKFQNSKDLLWQLAESCNITFDSTDNNLIKMVKCMTNQLAIEAKMVNAPINGTNLCSVIAPNLDFTKYQILKYMDYDAYDVTICTVTQLKFATLEQVREFTSKIK
jgi:hypothetical protein